MYYLHIQKKEKKKDDMYFRVNNSVGNSPLDIQTRFIMIYNDISYMLYNKYNIQNVNVIFGLDIFCCESKCPNKFCKFS